MRTLYVTDLDGTLLGPDAHVSETSAAILNRLTDTGMLFAAATARSPATAAPLLQAVRFRLPAVLLNGVFLYDLENKRILDCFAMPEQAARAAIGVFERAGQCPFHYQLDGDGIRAGFTRLMLPIHRQFYEERRHQAYKQFVQVDRLNTDAARPSLYLTLTQTQEVLAPIRAEIEKIPGLSSVFYRDNYTPYWYLEVFSEQASKPNGARLLLRQTGAQRLVAFGDNFNDLPLFQAADECYAVANAHEEVRLAATAVIGSNEEDGVARYLLARQKSGRL